MRSGGPAATRRRPRPCGAWRGSLLDERGTASAPIRSRHQSLVRRPPRQKRGSAQRGQPPGAMTSVQRVGPSRFRHDCSDVAEVTGLGLTASSPCSTRPMNRYPRRGMVSMNDACAGLSPSARRSTEMAWIRLSSVTATSCQAAAMISSRSTARSRCATRYANASSARDGSATSASSRHSLRA